MQIEQRPHMSKCSPSRSQNDHTCFALEELELMCTAWNKTKVGSKDQIPISRLRSYSNNDPNVFKRHLWIALRDKFAPICGNNEACWLDSIDLGKQLKELSPDAFKIMNHFTLKPKGTKKKDGWLTTNEIDYVMQQYAVVYPNFKYIGCFPSDHFILSPSKFPSEQLDEYKQAALVFNLDASHQKGSHWVAIFFDVDEQTRKRRVEYFDPTGAAPNKNIKRFLDDDYFIDSDVVINKKVHQRGNNECGVYSLFYILERLKGKSMDDINSQRIPDAEMNRFRSFLFRPYSERF